MLSKALACSEHLLIITNSGLVHDIVLTVMLWLEPWPAEQMAEPLLPGSVIGSGDLTT